MKYKPVINGWLVYLILTNMLKTKIIVLLIVAIFSMALVPAKAVEKSDLIKSMKFDSSSVNKYYQAVGGKSIAEKLLKRVISAKNETEAMSTFDSFNDTQRKAVIARFSDIKIYANDIVKADEVKQNNSVKAASSTSVKRVENKRQFRLREGWMPDGEFILGEFGTTDEITYKKNNRILSSKNISTTGKTFSINFPGAGFYYSGIVSDNQGVIIENGKKFYHSARGKFEFCILGYGCVLRPEVWVKTWMLTDGSTVKQNGYTW